MKIKLTEEQINSLIEGERELLQKKFDRDVEQLRKQLDNEMELLKKKYSSIDINIDIEEKSKGVKKKMDENEWKEMFSKGMKNKEIANITGYNAAYISILRKKYSK